MSYRAVAALFQIINTDRTDYKYSVTVTLFEIYNEKVRDLLKEQPPGNIFDAAKYEIHKGSRGMEIADLTYVEVESQRDIIDILALGMVNRSVGATNVNENSSRSHSLLTVYVEGVNTITGLRSFGKLHMVDLAGCERIKDSGSEGEHYYYYYYYY